MNAYAEIVSDTGILITFLLNVIILVSAKFVDLRETHLANFYDF